MGMAESIAMAQGQRPFPRRVPFTTPPLCPFHVDYYLRSACVSLLETARIFRKFASARRRAHKSFMFMSIADKKTEIEAVITRAQKSAMYMRPARGTRLVF